MPRVVSLAAVIAAASVHGNQASCPEAKDGWINSRAGIYCDDAKKLHDSVTLAECQDLVQDDPDCGGWLYTDGESPGKCRCSQGKTCDFRESGSTPDCLYQRECTKDDDCGEDWGLCNDGVCMECSDNNQCLSTDKPFCSNNECISCPPAEAPWVNVRVGFYCKEHIKLHESLALEECQAMIEKDPTCGSWMYTNGTGGSMPKGLCRCTPIEKGACEFQGSRPKYPDCVYEYQCPTVDACWPITTTPTTIATTTKAAAGTADNEQEDPAIDSPATSAPTTTKAAGGAEEGKDAGEEGQDAGVDSTTASAQDSASDTTSAADTKTSETSQARQDLGTIGVISASVAAVVLQLV